MEFEYISPPDLSTLLEHNPSSVLILDTRNQDDYSRTSIASSVQFNLTLAARVHRSVLFPPRDEWYVSPPEAITTFRHRGVYNIVVVGDSGDNNNKMLEFVRVLEEDKMERIGKDKTKSVYILVGGFNTYHALYPALCVGSPQQDSLMISKLAKKLMENAPTQIMPYLFCGGVKSALDQRVLDILGIEYIIITVERKRSNLECNQYLDCGMDELPAANLIPVFTKANRFIDAAKSAGGKVLVFSEKGTNRSCMIVCAYLMQYHNWCVEKAFFHLKNIQPSCEMNIVTLKKLLEYEKYMNFPRDQEVKNTQHICEELVYLRIKQREEEEDSGDANDVVEDNLC